MERQGQKQIRRRARKFSWLILLAAFPLGVLLENKFPASSAGFWVIVLGLGLFVIVFLGPRDILEAIKQIAVPVTKLALSLLAVGVALVLMSHFAPSLFPESPWAYALRYDTDSSHVHVAPKPTDCDFLHAPIGLKSCHYEKFVGVTHYAKGSDLGRVSFDGGKSWSPLREGEMVAFVCDVPQSWSLPAGEPGVTVVFVGWNRRVEGAQ